MKRDHLLLGIGIFTLVIPSAYLFFAVTYLFLVPLLAGLFSVVLAFAPKSKRRRMIGIGACIIAIFGVFGLIMYSNRSGTPIKLVVPDGFVGELTIRFDEVNGTPPIKDDGFWVYRLGDDGTLLTSDDSPFYQWHEFRVVFRDGRFIHDHGFQLTGGGVRVTGDDTDRVHYWTLKRSDANNAE